MAESFENLDNILRDWAKDKVQKSLVEVLNRHEKQEDERQSRLAQKIYSSSLSRQSSETKPSTKLVLVSEEPLLCLEFNKPNKQNVYEINFFLKNSTFLSLKIIVDTLIDVRNETSKLS